MGHQYARLPSAAAGRSGYSGSACGACPESSHPAGRQRCRHAHRPARFHQLRRWRSRCPQSGLCGGVPDTDPPRRGFNGIRICPSHPAGFAYLSNGWRATSRIRGHRDRLCGGLPIRLRRVRVSGLLALGRARYLKIAREFVRLARLQYPAVKFILGTCALTSARSRMANGMVSRRRWPRTAAGYSTSWPTRISNSRATRWIAAYRAACR